MLIKIMTRKFKLLLKKRKQMLTLTLNFKLPVRKEKGSVLGIK
jgi:hypothetical protein